MPCMQHQEISDQLGKDNALLRNMLCGLCSRVPTTYIEADPVLWVWWNEHVLEDKRRELSEATHKRHKEIIEKLKEKLTLEEKEALGLR